MPVLLRDIHTILRKDPEIVTILSEEEIGTIISGLKEVAKVDITTSAVKKAGTKTLKSLTLDDL